jgi:hypothetical protein
LTLLLLHTPPRHHITDHHGHSLQTVHISMLDLKL